MQYLIQDIEKVIRIVITHILILIDIIIHVLLYKVKIFFYKVNSMKVTEEFIYWRDEKTLNFNTQNGMYPSVKRFSNRKRYTKMFYCYYTQEPRKYNHV